MSIETTTTAICNVAMQAFASALRAASDNSPLSLARVALGDRFIDAVSVALRQSIKDALDSPEMRDAIANAPAFAPVAPLWIATVVADTNAAIIAAAGQEA